ncbi:MAG: MerR family transcriptional regulator [Candidatus Sabulitectum sp.]|nr:MerR family transcriptional regulator [Candidatus Sabulitectum sp.]
MIRIGLFSKLCQVPVKTLRYYDEIGLLKPAEIDRFTSYRYYSIAQLPRLNRILALKDLGLSLDQIARLLAEDIPIEQLRGMLRLKEVEIQQQMRKEQEKLSLVAARLKQIEQEDEMSKYDVVIKKVESQRIASVRDVIPAYPEQGALWGELETMLSQKKIKRTGSCFTLYHSDEPKIDAEVCEPIAGDGSLPADARVQTRELHGTEVAAVIHHGSFATINEAYGSLVKWIETNGYQFNGPCREIYLQPPAETGNQNDPDTVTEIQFPVVKA